MGQYQSLYQYSPSIPISRWVNIPAGNSSYHSNSRSVILGQHWSPNNCLNIHVFSKKKKNQAIVSHIFPFYFHLSPSFHPNFVPDPSAIWPTIPSWPATSAVSTTGGRNSVFLLCFPFSNVCPMDNGHCPCMRRYWQERAERACLNIFSPSRRQ